VLKSNAAVVVVVVAPAVQAQAQVVHLLLQVEDIVLHHRQLPEEAPDLHHHRAGAKQAVQY
jgi:hypothetical protein